MLVDSTVRQASASSPGNDGAGGTPPDGRMAWLDALRGVAALMVVHEHLLVLCFPGLRAIEGPWFLCGYAGVCLFFLISGYIIPASLERRGDLRRFWLGRMFRLGPLFSVALLALVGLHSAGLRPLDPYAVRHPGWSALAQVTMFPRLLGVPEMLGVTWTLAFEMLFYLVVVALFATGRQRAGTAIAWLLAGTAIVVGAAMPVELLTRSGLPEPVLIAGGAAALIVAVTATASGRRPLVVAGAVLGGLLAALLLAVNQDSAHRWDGLLFPALMLTGTAVYRAEHRQLSRWYAAATALVVGTAWVVQDWRILADAGPLFYAQYRPRTFITMGTVALLFAAGMALRRRRFPRVLVRLGTISYSLYLLHLVIFETITPRLGALGVHPATAPLPVQAAVYAGLVAATVACSEVTYRLVEAPAQAFGHRLARRLPAPRL